MYQRYVISDQERGLLVHFDLMGGFALEGYFEHDKPKMKATAHLFQSIP